MVQVFPGLETEMDLESIKILGTFFSKQDIIVNRTLFKKKKIIIFAIQGCISPDWFCCCEYEISKCGINKNVELLINI